MEGERKREGEERGGEKRKEGGRETGFAFYSVTKSLLTSLHLSSSPSSPLLGGLTFLQFSLSLLSPLSIHSPSMMLSQLYSKIRGHQSSARDFSWLPGAPKGKADRFCINMRLFLSGLTFTEVDQTAGPAILDHLPNPTTTKTHLRTPNSKPLIFSSTCFKE